MATEPIGTITTLQQQKIQDNHDLFLDNVWLSNPSAYKPQLWQEKNSPNVDAYDFLFVALSNRSPDFLTNILKIHKEKRMYLLLSNDFEGKLPNHKKILYRRVSRQFLDVCVGGKGDVAFLCLSNEGAYRLDKQQSKDIFSYLLYRFWHESDAEKTWQDKETPLILSRPSDIDRPIDTVQYISLSGSTIPKSPCYSGDIGYRCSEAFTHKMLPPTHHNLPKKDKHDVVWTDMGDFTIKVKGNETWVEYELDFEHRFVLNLGPNNATHIASELRSAINNPNWIFHTELQQGKIQHPIWMLGESTSREIEEEQILEEKDIQATDLSLMTSLKPKEFKEGSDYCRKISWNWKVIPPYRHQKSKVHLLHETWDKMIADYNEKKSNVEKMALKLQEDKRGLVAKWFLSLMGWERNDKKIQQNIVNLADLSSLSSLELCKENVEQLEGILVDLKKQDEILGEEKYKAQEKSREKIEREQFEIKQQDLLEKKHAQEQHIQILIEKQRQHEVLRTLLNQQQEGDHAHKEKNDKESNSNDDSMSKTLLSPKELERLYKEIEKTKKEIQKSSKALEKNFVFTPKKKLLKSSNSSLNTFDNSIQIPHRSLPLVGTLYKSKTKCFLEIENWEDLELGLEEAKKFGAKLVAQRPSKKNTKK